MLYLRYVSFNWDNLTAIFKIYDDLGDLGYGPCFCYSFCTYSDISDMIVTHQAQSLPSQKLDQWGDKYSDNGLQCGFGHMSTDKKGYILFCFALLFAVLW